MDLYMGEPNAGCKYIHMYVYPSTYLRPCVSASMRMLQCADRHTDIQADEQRNQPASHLTRRIDLTRSGPVQYRWW